MSEGHPAGMSFPQKVHTEDEDFVIELDENHMAGPHDPYGMDDRSRCKRRKRCGQCGPCQVKENCMKCHFCIRKDVLKQTCIYRKCVYLRSKPKPYSRPQHQSPQGRSVSSPPREVPQVPPHIKSPSSVHTHAAALSHGEPGPILAEPRVENPFFPPQLPQQPSVGTHQNNGYMSPPHPTMERTPSLPNPSGNAGMNMQMNRSPLRHVQNHATSPPIKPHEVSSPPQPIHSPMAALTGIPISSCSNVPHMPPHVGPTMPPVIPQLSGSSMPTIPSITSIPGIGERSLNDFRHPDQFSLAPHHPHPHYAAVHPHNVMSHRDSGLFGDHSRLSHMNFNQSNPMDSLSRGPSDSSCMYHPALPYSVPGHYQASGASFLPGAAEMNPFRSNFLNTFPPGYSYPPDRYREGFGSLPFSRLGMASTSSFPQYPGQTGGYGVGNSLSQQYYNSQHGCPKNGSRPPVSPSIDDVKVLQEGYNIHDNHSAKSKDPSSVCVETKTEVRDEFEEEDGRNIKSDHVRLLGLSPRHDHLWPWADFYSQRMHHRLDSLTSPNHRGWESWKSGLFYSPRRDGVYSRASTSTVVSSDFEAEVISIDDQQVNALIRSDGCNSFEIELDNRSMCSSDSSPRKVVSRSSTISGFISPEKSFDRQNSSEHWLDSSYLRHRASIHDRDEAIKNAFNLDDSFNGYTEMGDSPEKACHVGSFTPTKPQRNSVKSCFKDWVCLKQDLGDEGIVQLELPGHRVTIEDVVFNTEMLKHSTNIAELKQYLTDERHLQQQAVAHSEEDLVSSSNPVQTTC